MADADPTRRRVLEAAGPLFAARGFDAVSVRDIITDAGCNLAAVNYHFGTKEALYVETVRHAGEAIDLFSPTPAFPDAMPPEERLLLFIRAFLGRVLDPRGPRWQRELIFRELADPRPGACEGFVHQFVRPTFTALLGIVHGLAPAGLPDETYRMLAGSVIGQILHYHHCRHVIAFLVGPEGQKAHTPDALAAHIHRFSLAALRGYRAEGPS